MDEDGVRRARVWADVYKSLGYQPLPSRMDEKRPMTFYADLWEKKAPDNLFNKFETTNLQLMTGRHWNLAVLDIDGPEAADHVWRKWPLLPRTWVTGTGGGGEHWWFWIASDLPERRKTMLWRGEGDHSGVELLVDRSLIIAPPSVHPRTGKRYQFMSAGRAPHMMERPANLPRWLWDMPAVEKPSAYEPRVPLPPRRMPPEGSVDRRHVMDAIRDKAAVARAWGLRFATNPMGASGWVSVHDPDREDRRPSARFHPETGRFWRPGLPSISLFDLGVVLGHYPDWVACKDDLASRYLVAI